MLSTGEEIRSPQRSSRSGAILAKMPCTIVKDTYLTFFILNEKYAYFILNRIKYWALFIQNN